MSDKVQIISSCDTAAWDAYVTSHASGTLYHLSGWRNVIKKAYGHKTYYLMAIQNHQESQNSVLTNPTNLLQQANRPSIQKLNIKSINMHRSTMSYHEDLHQIVGILPLIHLKHFIFGNSLISIPYFDFAGILANDPHTEKALLDAAIELGRKLGVDSIEIRNTQFPSGTERLDTSSRNILGDSLCCETHSYKVRMLLHLPNSPEVLMQSFKSKLRSQIKRPLKEKLQSRVGGIELLGDFYQVFSLNMRDLGSPVHSEEMIRGALEEYPEDSKVIIVYKDSQPLACSLIVGYKDTLENPWASSLRAYSKMSPNMLLYWTMLEYACNHGFKHFDFGRSSHGEGTYKFKEQWGARPIPLHWTYISFNGKRASKPISEDLKYAKAAQIWRKLPLQVTKIIGPRIRKHIGL